MNILHVVVPFNDPDDTTHAGRRSLHSPPSAHFKVQTFQPLNLNELICRREFHAIKNTFPRMSMSRFLFYNFVTTVSEFEAKDCEDGKGSGRVAKLLFRSSPISLSTSIIGVSPALILSPKLPLYENAQSITFPNVLLSCLFASEVIDSVDGNPDHGSQRQS